MLDYFLKFADEAEALNALAAENAINDEGDIITASHDFAIDPVGVIYKPTGNTLTDEDGMSFPEMAPIEGWHVNVRMINGVLPASLEAFVVVPSAPVRVFA